MTTQSTMKMPKLDMRGATREEVKEFDLMKQRLREHNAYFNKKKYYPANMDEFDRIANEIQFVHREKIMQMQKARREKAEEEEREELRQSAATALLMLSAPPPAPKKIAPRRNKEQPSGVRRSKRLIEKEVKKREAEWIDYLEYNTPAGWAGRNELDWSS